MADGGVVNSLFKPPKIYFTSIKQKVLFHCYFIVFAFSHKGLLCNGKIRILIIHTTFRKPL